MRTHAASFILMAFNQEKTIAAAVAAALAQDGEPLDIILSDDDSSDGTFAVMARMAAAYSGIHRVRARKSARNAGVMHHLAEVVALADGELLIFAAGDDVSLPNRATEIMRVWRANGAGTAALYSDYFPVDEHGGDVDLGPSYFFAEQHSLPGMAAGVIEAFGGSAAYTRDLFTRFPTIRSDVIHEDRVLPFRALLLGGQVIPIGEKLVRYTIVGGVSRQRFPADMRDFVRRYYPAQQKRILPDAQQRVLDVAALGSAPAGVARLCRRTTTTHRVIIAISAGKGLHPEFALARGLLTGAFPDQAVKHYLKRRLRVPYRGQRSEAVD